MVQSFLDQLSAQPQAWNILRWIAEAGFRGEKAVIGIELQPWRDDNRRFLDLGCGTGEFASSFPADRYVGIDPAAHYVRFAGAARPGEYAVMSGAGLGMQDASFDAALVLGVFHHLPDDVVREVVAELHRVLKPGATLLVMEDIAPPDWANPLGHAMHWLDRGGFIRDDAAYGALMTPQFTPVRNYAIRSGICDYAVYVLERTE